MGKVGKYIRYYAYLCIFAAVIMARMGKDIFSNYYVFRACGFVVLGYCIEYIVCIFKRKKEKYVEEYNFKYIVQSFFLTGFLGLWFLIALLYPCTDKSNRLIIFVQIVSIVISFIFWTIKFVPNLHKFTKKGLSLIKENIYTIPILLCTFVLSIPAFQLQPFYDENTYFNLAQNLLEYDFSIKNSWLILCDHLSMGTNFFLLPGLIISGGRIWGIRIIIFFLVLIMSWCTYWICRFYLKKYSRWISILATAVLIVFPTTVSTQNLNVDYFSLLFLPILIAAYLYGYKILFFIFALCLCFSKETSAILYLGFVCGVLLKEYVERDNKIKLLNFIKENVSDLVYYLAPIGFWGTSFIANYFAPNLTIWGQYVNDNGEIVNHAYGHYGTNLSNVIMLFAQFFLENGVWLVLLLSIILLIYAKKKGADFTFLRKYYPYIGAIIGNVFINCIYTTYYNYRYKSMVAYLVVFLSILICCEVISFLFEHNVGFKICLGMSLLCCLFLIEQIYVVDPLTLYIERNAMFPSFDEIIEMKNMDKNYPIHDIKISDTINLTFYIRPLLLEKIMKDIEYDDNTLVILGGDTNEGRISLDMGYFSRWYLYYYPEAKKLSLQSENAFDEEAHVANVAAYNLDSDGRLNFYDPYMDNLDWMSEFSRIIYIDYDHEVEFDVEDFATRFCFSEYELISKEHYFSWKANVYELYK